MAMQIMFARISGKVIEYPDNPSYINVTDNLKPICNEFFKEESFLEDEEEIIVQVVRLEEIKKLSERIEKQVIALLGQLKRTKGDSAKEEIEADIRDYIMLSSLIISMLVSTRGQNAILTIS